MRPRLERILVATDLTPGADLALVHALRLAIGCGARLAILHAGPAAAVDQLPRVRTYLERWRAQLPGGLDLQVEKVVARTSDAVRAILDQAAREPPDLIVLGKHPHDGLAALLDRQVALAVARAAAVPTWFFPDGTRGVVDALDGRVRLQRVLVPFDLAPPAAPAVRLVESLAAALGASQLERTLLHVGDDVVAPPVAPGWSVRRVPGGDPAQGIHAAAAECVAELVALTTRWREGWVDALLGSTAEQFVRRACTPVLVVPAV